MKTLTIVIPFYNEENTLDSCVNKVIEVEVPLKKEIVLVDDSSTDNSYLIAQKIIKKNPDIKFKLTRHQYNSGKGAALKSGFNLATGDILIIQDADMEYSPFDFPKLVAPILEGRVDVVYGSRFKNHKRIKLLTSKHYAVNFFLTLLSNMFTKLKLTDMETCYKVFSKQVIKKISIKSKGFGIEPEITAKIAKNKWRICEVAISYQRRTHSEGKKITWKDGFVAVLSIFYCGIKYSIGSQLKENRNKF